MAGDPQGNNLVRRLIDADARIRHLLVAVQLSAREVLHEPGMPALYVYFPTTAVISLVSTMESGASAEVAAIGREGMVGLAGLLGTVESPTTAVVQIGGAAFKAPAAAIRAERLRVPAVRAVLDLYTEARLIQVAQTAACNRLHGVEARLARWVLAIADRIDADSFRLSQEFMAQMLGVHRPTVSTTLQRLKDAGVISSRGRSIVIADRQRLERVACECYGVLRREFDRLLRPAIGGLDALPRAIERSVNHDNASTAALEAMRDIAGRLLLANIREQQARDDAEAANRAKDQFLAMVSHELRTPLNAILGWCTMLAARPDPSLDRGLTVIQRNAHALQKLVDELLDAARLTSATLSIQPALVTLQDVIRGAVDAVRPSADAKQVALRLTMIDELSPTLADADRLRQVFLNVLTNALKFTGSGGSIDVLAATDGEAMRVSVCDTGRGIAADVLPHVFERFRQGTDPTIGHQGLGLGLTIARVLVELHGGTIEIASPGEGRGTTCTIELPLRTDAAAALARAASAGP
jgi:signal transduction histidine kinase